MSRRVWIIILVVVVLIAAAIGIGIWATQDDDDETKSEAVSALCTSLQTLDSSVQTLLALDSSTASKSDYETDITAVDTAWDQVKSDAQDVQDAPTGDLDTAWDDFTSTVQDVPDDASVSDALNDIKESGQALVSTAQSTASEIDCTSTSS